MSTKPPRSRNSAVVLISLQQGADTVGICTKTLRRWISAGRLTGYRVGPHLIRIDREELLALARPLATA